MRFERSSAIPFIVSSALIVAACSSSSSNSSPDGGTLSNTSSSGGSGNPSGTSSTTGGAADGGSTSGESTTGGFSSSGTVETGCGAKGTVKCAEGEPCKEDADCNGACSYAGRCVDSPSCKTHLGGDTCGKGEVGTDGAKHESCCRTLPVKGFSDGAHPGKEVLLDKYEITTGRVRAFLEAMAAKYGGKPDVQRFVTESAPMHWNPNWTQFLPSDRAAGTITVAKENLGDPRPAPDGHQPIPDTDQVKKTGSDYQFNAELLLYLHGNNCGTAEQSYGFPTFFYPGDVLATMNLVQKFPPRPDGKDDAGKIIPASEHLEVKSMNCITNAMLVAFCAWDGGQLATEEVLDFVTGTPPTLGDKAGCGTQSNGTDPPATDAEMKGGRCADLDKINATFDAGGTLPTPNHPRNAYNYIFPFYDSNYDKAWEIAAPGRGTWATNKEPADMVRIDPMDEPWMDLAGNLSEAALKTQGGISTGKFALKYRGIGYQSARSHLNVDLQYGVGGMKRLERAEAKAGFTGGRCMRFR